MNKADTIMKEDNIRELLEIVLLKLNIRITTSKFLKDIHRYLSQDKDVIKCICNVFGAWSIDAKYLPLHVDMINDLPIPSLIFLYRDQFDKSSGRFVILLHHDNTGARVLDVETGEIFMDKNELQAKWSNIIIAIDAEGATDENNYDQKIAVEKARISSAGGVTVIMPVYNQASFVTRAIISLQKQTYNHWELIIINDGSKDNIYSTIYPFLKDERIRYFMNEENKGLGYSLNKGLDNASYDMISYLPADDIYFKDHLQKLVEALVTTDSTFVYSGVLHHFNSFFDGNYGKRAPGIIENYPLQLVQALHSKTKERWMERDELVTDDLNRMFWGKLLHNNNKVVGTREVTCEWVDHATQRHKIINDKNGGGIYLYKRFYGVKEPIRFQSTYGNFIDEQKHYENFRKPLNIPLKQPGDGLKILLVGELSFNPERICAFEERGHKLYGLWLENPVNFNGVGPLPFGNVEDIPFEGWRQRIAEIKPDIIYALLNHHAVPLAYHVLTNNPGIPFVWHFKEGPFYCRSLGTWNQLISLYSKSDGQIYTNETVYEWFQHFLPSNNGFPLILDGDLPKKEWFSNQRSGLLSEKDGEIHTVVAGRPMGLFAEDIRQMADQRIHLHLYGDIFHNQFKEVIKAARKIAPKFVHLHSNCPQSEWAREFSQYDAGWLHFFHSHNHGELLRASWHDLNFPARMATYGIAGIPMLMRDNNGHRVACQEFLEKKNMALLFKSFENLKEFFDNKDLIENIRKNVWNNRHIFSFDAHVDDLLLFFRKVINRKSCKPVEIP